MTQTDFKHETALLWDGNFWDDGVHDYADLSWDVVDTLTNKIANVFKDYCESGDSVLLLLHNVIQLPLCLMGASRIGAVSVILNPVTTTTSQLTELIKETSPKLIVTVDAFWQGHTLIEIKRQLDQAVSEANVS
ncbi:AMP-binding domain-containing protein [Trichostrongylus colubriformis]|uniref:acetate--CoA ligase n=1 Tax=Trichostrongylus colubriformis TaxID=6319 RepID=A0AAN8IT55_TRICO